ncbi:MAG: hypothetical protein JRG83_10715 [Deltaproteobacteria bacterium]|nr:hypothetical protein [Deltaproteobacteria bacterium]
MKRMSRAKSVSWFGLHAGLALCLILAPGVVAQAGSPVDPDALRWSFQFEPMAMTVRGDEQELAKIQTFTFAGGSSNPADSDRVVMALDEWDFAFRGDLEVRQGAWGFGMTGFQFDTEKQERKRINASDVFDFVGPNTITPPGPDDRGAVILESAYALSGFDGGFSGIRTFMNTVPGNESSPLDVRDRQIFEAETSLDVWSVDVYAIRQLFDSAKAHLDAFVGAKIGSCQDREPR